MKTFLSAAAMSLAVGLVPASTAQAQVFVRAPFVRVQVGGGVYVRAPFVNLYIPARGANGSARCHVVSRAVPTGHREFTRVPATDSPAIRAAATDAAIH